MKKKEVWLARIDTENEVHLDRFEVARSVSVSKVRAALRAAVKEFLGSSEAHVAIQVTHGCFNWGDAISFVPDDVWRRHGLRLVETGHTALGVNHNESLLQPNITQ